MNNSAFPLTDARESDIVHAGATHFDPNADLPWLSPEPGPAVQQIPQQTPFQPLAQFGLGVPSIADETLIGKVANLALRLHGNRDNIVEKLRIFKQLQTALAELQVEIDADRAELLKELGL